MKRPTFLRRLPLIRSIRSARGQSLVEFTLLLPVLLIMMSGLIEFGFMLNYYLDLIDASREASRWGAGEDLLHCDTSPPDPPCMAANAPSPFNVDPNANAYTRICDLANSSIDVGSGGQIDLDTTTDDIVVSAFGIAGGVIAERYPTPLLDAGWACSNPGGAGNHSSQFTTADVQALLNPAAPNTGVVMVEMWYDYHMILGLPWITAFVPDPVTLYAYSMMPNPNVEPTPTP